MSYHWNFLACTVKPNPSFPLEIISILNNFSFCLSDTPTKKYFHKSPTLHQFGISHAYSASESIVQHCLGIFGNSGSRFHWRSDAKISTLLFCLLWLTLPPLASLVTMYSWIEFLILAHSTAGSRRRGGAENWNTSLRTSSSRETRSTSSFSVSPRLERCRYANSLCTSRLPDEVKYRK